MADAVTYSIEIAVGVACLAAAPAAWPSSKWLACVLLVAGLAAVIHAVFALAG